MPKRDGYANIEREYSNGILRYGRKKQDTSTIQSDPNVRKAIGELKTSLKKEVSAQAAQRRGLFRQVGVVVDRGNGKDRFGSIHTLDPKKDNQILLGEELKARNYDANQIRNNIANIIQQLAMLGVKTKVDRANGTVSFKNMNEGGQPKMVYDVARLKQMKLETFQESASGKITKEATDYLLKYFDVMIEAAKGEDLNSLVKEYIDACKEGDDEKKEELKEKITAASNCEKAKKELEELKENLSDREKEFVEELDEEICGKSEDSDDNDGGDDDDENSDENDSDDDDSEQPVEESGEECGSGGTSCNVKNALSALKKKKGSAEGTDKSNEGGNAEAFDQLLTAASESTITDIGKNAVLDYVTESVAYGDMDADQAIFLTTLLSM